MVMKALRTLAPLSLAALLVAGCGDDDPGGSSGGSGGSGGSGSGASGSGGSGATSSGGSGGSLGAECETAADCTLFDDCCACAALAEGEAEPAHACPMASCLVGHCQSVQAGPVACISGRCVLDVECDLSGVTCDIPEPMCEDGFVLHEAQSCYGGCIEASECPTPAG